MIGEYSFLALIFYYIKWLELDLNLFVVPFLFECFFHSLRGQLLLSP